MNKKFADSIGYKTEFGFALSLLRQAMQQQTRTLLVYMKAWEQQYRIAELAIKFYPNLNVQLDNPQTYPFSVAFPLIRSGEAAIDIRFPPCFDTRCSRLIGKLTSIANGEVKFKADARSLGILFECVEAWQRWDELQSVEAGAMEIGDSNSMQLPSGELRNRYNFQSAKQIRDWAKDPNKQFIRRVKGQRQYEFDPNHPAMRALEKQESDIKRH